MGLEPTIFRLEVGRLIHWATRVLYIPKREYLRDLNEFINTKVVCWFHSIRTLPTELPGVTRAGLEPATTSL